jgi:hypothetical protein
MNSFLKEALTFVDTERYLQRIAELKVKALLGLPD